MSAAVPDSMQAAAFSVSGLPVSLQKRLARRNATALERLFPENAKRAGRLASLRAGFATPTSEAEELFTRRARRATGRTAAPDLSGIFRVRLALPVGVSVYDAIGDLAADPNIVYAEPDYIAKTTAIPNDPLFPVQWSLQNTGQVYPASGSYNAPPGTAGADISAPEAWDTTTGSESLIIAVNDSGVDYNHRDLAGNIWVNTAENGGVTGVDDDSNGFVDDVRGFNFYVDNGYTSDNPVDTNGHGTHCAGTIAARGNNGLDISGVCWAAKVMIVKAFNQNGYGTVSGAAQALIYAVDNGADLVSNSWTTTGKSSVLADAVTYAEANGVLLVAAAGNSYSTYKEYPAAYSNVIAVAASNSVDQRPDFSNFGYWVDVAAPGVDILSLRAAGTSLGAVQSSWTTVLSGTSMACPHVAGLMGLALLVHPTYNLDELRALPKTTSDPFPVTYYAGQGRVNADWALNLATRPPVAILNIDGYRFEDGKIGGVVPVAGTAKGNTLTTWDLGYGVGRAPITFTGQTTGTSEVTSASLGTFDTVPLWWGWYSVRLNVTDSHGQRVEEMEAVDIENMMPRAPMNNDILRPSAALPVRADFRTSVTVLAVEESTGHGSSAWTTVGVTVTNGPGNQIATWDTSSVTTPTFKNLRYTLQTSAGIQHDYVDMIHFDPRMKPGFPCYLPVDYTAGLPVDFNADFNVVDLDGDGNLEILALVHGEYNPDFTTKRSPRILCFSHLGQTLWDVSIPTGPYAYEIPVAADIDNDGYLEVIVCTGWEPTLVRAYRHDGTPYTAPGWPVTMETSSWALVAADIDLDGETEIIARSEGGVQISATDWALLLVVIEPDGTISRRIPLAATGHGLGGAHSSPALLQADADPYPEIVTDFGAGVAVYNHDGTTVSGWSRSLPCTRIAASIAAGNADGTGRDEFVAVTFHSDNSTASAHLFDHAGNVMSGWPVSPGNS